MLVIVGSVTNSFQPSVYQRDNSKSCELFGVKLGRKRGDGPMMNKYTLKSTYLRHGLTKIANMAEVYAVQSALLVLSIYHCFITSNHYLLDKEGYVFGSIDFFCLSVCYQHYSKKYEWIVMKLYEGPGMVKGTSG